MSNRPTASPSAMTSAPSMLLELFAAADAHGVPTAAWLSGTRLTRRDLDAADLRLAERKVAAARMIALDEETTAIEPEATAAADPENDVL